MAPVTHLEYRFVVSRRTLRRLSPGAVFFSQHVAHS